MTQGNWNAMCNFNLSTPWPSPSTHRGTWTWTRGTWAESAKYTSPRCGTYTRIFLCWSYLELYCLALVTAAMAQSSCDPWPMWAPAAVACNPFVICTHCTPPPDRLLIRRTPAHFCYTTLLLQPTLGTKQRTKEQEDWKHWIPDEMWRS